VRLACLAFRSPRAARRAPAAAQAWPQKPIRLIVGFAPGGVADITARVVAQKLSEQLGQQVVVDNRPSAGGIVAADAVAKAAPDGYTLLLLTNGNAVSASLFTSLPYDTLNDFAPVSLLGTFDVAVVASAGAKLDSMGALMAYAKANPGKLNIGTINVGSTQHLSAEMFRSMAGFDATVVPFKGSPAVITALRANDVQVAFEMLAPVIPQAKSGAVRILAVTSEKRHPSLPDVPTVAESGVPGYAASSWNAIAAPAKDAARDRRTAPAGDRARARATRGARQAGRGRRHRARQHARRAQAPARVRRRQVAARDRAGEDREAVAVSPAFDSFVLDRRVREDRLLVGALPRVHRDAILDRASRCAATCWCR
jgi:tripartite-type tricarboxylate transporter receptor subunit TctC